MLDPIPISILHFINSIVGKCGTVIIDPNTNFHSEDEYDDFKVHDIIITGNPITLRDIVRAFVRLNLFVKEYFENVCGLEVFDFQSIDYDEEADKYIVTWKRR